MDVEEAIRYQDEATIRSARLCGKDGFELGPVMNRCGDRLQPEGRSGTSEWVEVIVDIWRRRRIKQQGGPLEARRNLLEKLKPLAGHRRLHDGETGGIAARACQALNEAAANRISNDHK